MAPAPVDISTQPADGAHPLAASRLQTSTNDTMLRRARFGFTIIELLVALSIVGILTGVALPSYIDYVQRSRVPVALDALSSYATWMEQRYQDTGSYASDGNCAASLPTTANFALSCSITSSGQGFGAIASGSGSMAGYSYSIDQAGNRVTLSHPRGVPAVHCWSLRGLTCDN